MPAEKAFSITEIVELLRNYDFSKQRRLSFEYIVFKGVNASLPYAKDIFAACGMLSTAKQEENKEELI